MDAWDALPWHQYETYLEYLRDTVPGGASRTDEHAVAVAGGPAVDEEPAPHEQTPVFPEPQQQEPSWRPRYNITQVSGFGSDAA